MSATDEGGQVDTGPIVLDGATAEIAAAHSREIDAVMRAGRAEATIAAVRALIDQWEQKAVSAERSAHAREGCADYPELLNYATTMRRRANDLLRLLDGADTGSDPG